MFDVERLVKLISPSDYGAGIIRIVRRISLLICSLIVAGLTISSQGKETPANPYRNIVYVYNDFVWTLTVRVTENAGGARGEVVAVRVPTPKVSRHGVFNISKAEFEQIWSTLNAPGVEKRVVSGAQCDLANEYLFQSGKQSYAVRKLSSAPAVSALSSRLHNHADAAVKLPQNKP